MNASTNTPILGQSMIPTGTVSNGNPATLVALVDPGSTMISQQGVCNDDRIGCPLAPSAHEEAPSTGGHPEGRSEKLIHPTAAHAATSVHTDWLSIGPSLRVVPLMRR